MQRLHWAFDGRYSNGRILLVKADCRGNKSCIQAAEECSSLNGAACAEGVAHIPFQGSERRDFAVKYETHACPFCNIIINGAWAVPLAINNLAGFDFAE